MLLSFGLMALVRIKSTEGLSTHAPGEFGRVLGLDRAPEMTTARRKLAELPGRGRALEFARAFAERWATEAQDALGYLYIDGHVRPYHGRTLTLPKTHVPRPRLCLPATTDYWVNDAHAEPLLFITAPANEGHRDRLRWSRPRCGGRDPEAGGHSVAASGAGSSCGGIIGRSLRPLNPVWETGRQPTRDVSPSE